jgi:CheY-like chemotaxis protein
VTLVAAFHRRCLAEQRNQRRSRQIHKPLYTPPLFRQDSNDLWHNNGGGPGEHGKRFAAQGGVSDSDRPQRGHIFAIDDEEGFLGLLKMALERDGYIVDIASSPKEAIAFYKERWRDIGMVFLDFLMPDMSGDLVFEELQRLNPDVRVVLLTGCEDSIAEKMFLRGLRGYLQKPFSLPDLAQKANEAIHGS